MNWFVYIIRADDGSLYTGITTDVERRFREHAESPRGAKYFKGKTPVEVAWSEGGHDRSSASKRESEIKSWPRHRKLELLRE